ncbi:MAG: hypothetical protein IT198_15060 [Acidimicrobiia bacterium]|nr:hypothetical protein [Acidimicrobiia bacterium]
MTSLVVWIIVAIVVITILSIAGSVLMMKWSWDRTDDMVDKSLSFSAQQQQQWMAQMAPMMDSQREYLETLSEQARKATPSPPPAT